ncbi:MAG: hypothetical protein M3063_16665 [Actinomycetota bacterium]|nr:hypothetical protein [Actinomycetota bacterium]
MPDLIPDITIPDSTIRDINKAFKDSAYAAVGFGVLSFQRAQVRRRELTEQLQGSNGVVGAQVAAARQQLAELTRRVDQQVAPVRRQLDERFDELEGRLPASTRNVFATIRSGAQAQESYLRNVVGLHN